MAIIIVQAKSTQKWYFLVSKPILKIFSLVIFYSMQKNWVKMVPKQVFKGAGIKRPPPTARDTIERVRLVGLKEKKIKSLTSKFPKTLENFSVGM